MFSYNHKTSKKVTFFDKYHKILLKENVKAAPDKSLFFLTRVKFLEHITEGTTITTSKIQISKLQYHQARRKFKNAIIFQTIF